MVTHVTQIKTIFLKIYRNITDVFYCDLLLVYNIIKTILIPVSGHGMRLQDRYLTLTPWQYFPPLTGTGLSHSRFDSCTPPPQDLEQVPNGPHLPHLPSTLEKETGREVCHNLHGILSFTSKLHMTTTKMYIPNLHTELLSNKANKLMQQVKRSTFNRFTSICQIFVVVT